MIMTMFAIALAGTQPPAAARIDPVFEAAAASCGADRERLAALAAFFELAAEQAIAEYQPNFALTPCLADAVHGRGGLSVIVEDGDRIVQVSRRLAVQKLMKKDAERFGNVELLAVKPGKAVPAERAGRLDRVLVSGEASALVEDPKRGAALLRSFGALTKSDGLLGIVDVPDESGAGAAKLTALARASGWEPAGQTGTEPPGLLLLKFRKTG